VDVRQLLVVVSEDDDYRRDQLSMLQKTGGMPAKTGLKYILEQYSSMAESINKLLNVVRASIEIVNGNLNPEVTKRSTINWEIISNEQLYSYIVEGFDPRIHGKTHNYEIDVEKRVINFYKDGRIRELLMSCTFDELRLKWKLIPYILTGLIISICMEQSAITGVVLGSTEYIQLLASIGNFKRKI
jgi:hypothetical protein